jgi:uncharacterized membrane protein YfcA
MFSLGVPVNEAKPTGLLINTLSMSGATYSNYKLKTLDISLGFPIIILSVILAPAGAYFSTFIPEKLIMSIFICFMLFSGCIMLFFRAKKYEDNYREDRPLVLLSFVGVLAGFISGLLGVGGGGIISPLLVLSGFNPKKVAAVTAFVVPFSSLTGFITYSIMGNTNLQLLALVSLSAFIGGYMGTNFMQSRLKPGTVKKFLGVIMFIMAIKLITKITGE